MKRLIVCNDGTWNTPDQEENGIPAPTNVVKLHNALAAADPQGIAQLRYYHPGVGAEGGLFDSIAGGTVGVGIGNHLRSAYHWIASNYQPGDEVLLFGFSRGAFTARSLAGLLDRGLLNLDTLPPGEAWRRVEAIYNHYRANSSLLEIGRWADPHWAFHHPEGSLPIRFIGVWDTVGALGIPDDLELLNLFDDPAKWKFHDTDLSPRVSIARHAMAIDEQRSSFTVTRWGNAARHEGDVKEVWFPGVHCDVGGGYSNCDLSDGALLWMIEEAEAAGLAFRPNIKSQLHPNPIGVMHNSFKGAFAKLRSRPRNVDALVPAHHARFHTSAILRQAAAPISYPAYRPTRLLRPGQTSDKIEIYADTHWNDTGYYLEPGTYTFNATGEWLDATDACDWRGTEADGKFTAGDLVRASASFLGKFETLWKRATRNASTDFLGTKRVENMPWFALVGAVANDHGERSVVPNDGSPDPHLYILLCQHQRDAFELKVPGYLHAFANDTWSLYDNNHGSVTLTITRIT